MTHAPINISDARAALGLSVAQLSALLDTDAQSVRRWSLQPGSSTARDPPPRVERLIAAYLAGYRPEDWPKVTK